MPWRHGQGQPAGVSPAGYVIQRDEAALALTDRMLLDFLGRTVGDG